MKSIRTALIVIAGYLLISGCTSHSQYSWPQFRGANSLGIAPENSIPPAEINTGKNLAWRIKLAPGLSSPCISNGKIFLTGFNSSDSSLTTYCIDQKRGTVLWERTVVPDSLEEIHQVGSHASPTPVTDGSHVYVYFGAYGISCYDMKGNLAWEKRLPMLDCQYGSNGSPILYDSLLLINRVDINDPTILVLNKNNGSEVWESELEPTVIGSMSFTVSQSTPVVWNDQVILHRSFQLEALSLKDGEHSWKIEIGTTGNSTPIIVNDTLYVNCWYNFGTPAQFDSIPEFKNMLSDHDLNKNQKIDANEIPPELAMFRRPGLGIPIKEDTLSSLHDWANGFDTDKDSSFTEAEWTSFRDMQLSFLKNHALLAVKLNRNNTDETPQIIWTENENVAEVPSLIKSGNRIYMVTNGGIVTSLDSKTGHLIFRDRLRAPGAYLSSPLLAGGNIYFASYNGKVTIIKPGDKLKIISQGDLDGKIGASPVALDRYLFIRTDSALFAFRN